MSKTVGQLDAKIGIDASGVVTGLHQAANAWKSYKAASESAFNAERRASQLAGAVETFIPKEEARSGFLSVLSAKANVEASAKAVEDAEARKTAAIERRAQVEARISQAMSLQRAQTLAQFTAKADPYDPSRLAAFAQATNHATLQTKQLWAAQIQAKVAANALAVSLGGTSSNSGVGAMRNMGNTSADSQKKLKHFQLAVQQGGYQLQDFIVQLASGQNGFVAFGQQASQMAGFFGKSGAWVGVGLAIASVAGMMLQNATAAEATTSKYKTLTEALEGYIEARRRLFLEGKDSSAERPFLEGDIRKLGSEQQSMEESAKKIQERQAKIAKDMRDKGQRDIFSLMVNLGRMMFSGDEKPLILSAEENRVEIVNKQIELKRIANNLATEEHDAASKQIDKERDRLESYKEQIKANEDFHKSDRQRLNDIYDQMDALKLLGRTGTIEFARLQGAADKLSASLTDRLAAEMFHDIYGNPDQRDASIMSLQQRMPEALQIRSSQYSYGLSSGSNGNQVMSLAKELVSLVRELVQVQRFDMAPA